MTEFQKEIGVIIVLLGFFLGCFVCVEIAHTETAGGSLAVKMTKGGSDEGYKGSSLKTDIYCRW